jgi:hypothetical protein
MINALVDDNLGILSSKQPSSLVEVPKVHEKYEIHSLKSNPQYTANLKTIEIVKNSQSGCDILNLNAGFFGGASQKA